MDMEIHNKIGDAAMEPMRPILAMHPRVLKQIRQFLRSVGSTGLYLQEVVDGTMRRQLMGYEVVVSNYLEKFDVALTGATAGDYQTTGTRKEAYPVYAVIVGEAAHYADLVHDPVIFSPTELQAGRYWQINMTGDHMYIVSDNRYIYRMAVRAEA